MEHAARTLAEPEALLFDMDGVLVDVSRSYRTAILQTVASFGGTTDPEAIEKLKQQGNANNDWLVCQRILEGQGIRVELMGFERSLMASSGNRDRTRTLYSNAGLAPFQNCGNSPRECPAPCDGSPATGCGANPAAIRTGRPVSPCESMEDAPPSPPRSRSEKR